MSVAGEDLLPARRAGEPELLLDAVNEASGAARGIWLFLIAMEAYFLVAIAGIGHRDLLLNTPVSQPILQVSVPLRSFVLFGPLLLLLAHAGVLQQHVVLSRKLKALRAAADALPGAAGEALRMRVSSYFISQLEAGPTGSRLLRWSFRAVG